MDKYSHLKTSKEFLALMKRLYFPPSGQVEEIEIPKMKFLSFDGKGAPASAGFQTAIQSLYAVAYMIKMGLKFGKLERPIGYFDYKLPPLEGLWWAPGGLGAGKKGEWRWKMMIMVPSFVTPELFAEAVRHSLAKRTGIPYSKVNLEDYEEGSVIQIMHIGDYSEEKPTIDKLLAYASEHAEKISGHHHEIYLNDPRRVKPDKIKTVLRYAVN